MFRLDSDIMGIVMALLTFLVPVISALLEKNRKKKKGQEADILPDSNLSDDPLQQQESRPQQADDIEQMFNQLLGIVPEPDETVLERETEEPEEIFEEARPQTVAAQCDPVAPDVPVPPVAPDAPVAPVAPDAAGQAVDKVEKGLKGRLARNPKDMVIFAEIMNPKFKEL